jgi:hypothetical protein
MFQVRVRLSRKRILLNRHILRKELSPVEKRLKEIKYTGSHGGPEVRINTNGKYFCLKYGSFICDEECSKFIVRVAE